jgi:PTH1 family peptidyl-tRNA hydrolase
MGLFDRQKTNYHTSAPLYTLGSSKSLLIIGLGNVGAEYHKTRHNVGFAAIDRYKDSHDFSDWIEKKDLQCYQSSGTIGDTRVILAKPTTFMNNSGEAAQKLQHFYKLHNEDTLVVFDELDVPFGTLRTRTGGGSAGHNGMKSLIAHIGEDFARIRVGIGPNPPAGGSRKMDSADFVLQKFSEDQEAGLPKILREISATIDERTTGPLQESTIKVI